MILVDTSLILDEVAHLVSFHLTKFEHKEVKPKDIDKYVDDALSNAIMKQCCFIFMFYSHNILGEVDDTRKQVDNKWKEACPCDVLAVLVPEDCDQSHNNI